MFEYAIKATDLISSRKPKKMWAASKCATARGLTKIFITDLCRIALGEKAFPE
jgi:hypothetical protein